MTGKTLTHRKTEELEGTAENLAWGPISELTQEGGVLKYRSRERAEYRNIHYPIGQYMWHLIEVSAKRGNYSCRDLHVRKLHVKMVEKFFRFFNFNNVMYSAESALLLIHTYCTCMSLYTRYLLRMEKANSACSVQKLTASFDIKRIVCTGKY